MKIINDLSSAEKFIKNSYSVLNGDGKNPVSITIFDVIGSAFFTIAINVSDAEYYKANVYWKDTTAANELMALSPHSFIIGPNLLNRVGLAGLFGITESLGTVFSIGTVNNAINWAILLMRVEDSI